MDFFFKIEDGFNFLVNFFFVRLNFKGISFVKFKPRRNRLRHVEQYEMGMCKIKGEEMRWIRMEPSYTELDYSFKIDGYWKF